MEQEKFASSISKHLIDTGHQVELRSAFRVIASCNRSTRLKFTEASALHPEDVKGDLEVAMVLLILIADSGVYIT